VKDNVKPERRRSSPMSRIGTLRSALMSLLEKHDRSGELPTSARLLYYELVQASVVSTKQVGTRRTDLDTIKALTQLREGGSVPWHWIVDETRSLEDYTGYPTIKEGLIATLPHINIDPWRGRWPMIITESRSLAGVLRRVATDYRVPIASTNGQCGGFLHTVVAPALKPGGTVAYVGDWNLAGTQIEDNTRRVLEHEVGGTFDWTRIALTEAQVRYYDLPIIIKHDRRYKNGGGTHRTVEAEALSQTVLINILRTWLDAMLPEPLDRVIERERKQRKQMQEKVR
jgi:hypothetical protein